MKEDNVEINNTRVDQDEDITQKKKKQRRRHRNGGQNSKDPFHPSTFKFNEKMSDDLDTRTIFERSTVCGTFYSHSDAEEDTLSQLSNPSISSPAKTNSSVLPI